MMRKRGRWRVWRRSLPTALRFGLGESDDADIAVIVEKGLNLAALFSLLDFEHLASVDRPAFVFIAVVAREIGHRPGDEHIYKFEHLIGLAEGECGAGVEAEIPDRILLGL